MGTPGGELLLARSKMTDYVPFCFFLMGDDDGWGDKVWDIPFLTPLREEGLGGMIVVGDWERRLMKRDGRGMTERRKRGDREDKIWGEGEVGRVVMRLRGNAFARKRL